MRNAPFILVCILVLSLTGCRSPIPVASNPEIFDPKADGQQQIDMALAQAKIEGKRVLLVLGANWCGDSQSMFRILQNDPEIHRELSAHYVLTLVDVDQTGDAPRNMNVVARFGEPLGRGIPVLLVLASDGKLLNEDPSERLADSDHEYPERVLAYLKRWAGPSTR